MAQVVSSHRAPKKATNITHLGINILVMECFINEFTNLRQIPSFTVIIIKVRNHKNGKLVKNKPECL